MEELGVHSEDVEMCVEFGLLGAGQDLEIRVGGVVEKTVVTKC